MSLETALIDPKLSMLAPLPGEIDTKSVASAAYERAVELLNSNNPADAYPLFVSVVTADPNHAAAWYHIGILLFTDQKYATARAAMEHVNQIRPNSPHVLTNLGWYAHASEDTPAGYEYLKRALELGPDLALGWSNMSQIQTAMLDLEGALRSAQKGVDLASDGNPIHSMCLAFVHLFRGELQQGLHYYEARFRYKLQQFLSYAFPVWKGEHVGTLFLRAEQGIGDTITTLRFLPECAKRAGKILLYINAELRTLVDDMGLSNVEVHALPAVLPAVADAWLPLMSIPLALGIETADLTSFSPPYVPVYRYEPSASPKPPKRIGIVWAGGSDMDMDRWRSMPLKAFLPLTYIPGVKLYSLQVGPPKQQIVTEGMHGLIEDLGPSLTDMRETAKVISNLDLVISVCTSTAHLSAAMGRPTYVLRNRRSSDWRWGLGSGYPSKWYSSCRIFERDYHQSWDDVIQQVRDEICKS